MSCGSEYEVVNAGGGRSGAPRRSSDNLVSIRSEDCLTRPISPGNLLARCGFVFSGSLSRIGSSFGVRAGDSVPVLPRRFEPLDMLRRRLRSEKNAVSPLE